MIRLFVTDLDGTILRPDETEISREILSCISAIAKSNVKTVIATGRSFHDIRPLFGVTAGLLYFITCDGALCTHNGKVIYSRPIPREDIINLLVTIKYINTGGSYYDKNSDSFGIVFHCAESDYVISSAEFAQLQDPPLIRVRSINEIQELIYKISIHGCQFPLTELAPTLRLSYVSDNIIEYVNKFANKATALANVQSTFCILNRGVVAVGDGENDILMLKKAGRAYAFTDEICAKSGAQKIDRVESLLHLLANNVEN